MDLKNAVTGLLLCFACSSCGPGFKSHPVDGDLKSVGNQVKEPLSQVSALDVPYQNLNQVNAKFDLKSVTNATWKLVGFIEKKSEAPQSPNGPIPDTQVIKSVSEKAFYLGISKSETVQKTCYGGPCPNLTAEQSILVFRTECQPFSLTAEFEQTTIFSNQGPVQTVKLMNQPDIPANCPDDSRFMISNFLNSIAQDGISQVATEIGIWDSYLYVDLYSHKIFVFQRQ